ncbi:PWWP domain-containing protein MUM1L1 [Triplophysa tibetana]|uniref:PWWP domain-containing protein MUM1L1 n=1 Tax=Triplophysa tibetana TaxID=1572043 RepID=A0A5A9MW07_9TELE|nr:PWWP domain-containing protein MUM1L1 [Triplophysa tibetana]
MERECERIKKVGEMSVKELGQSMIDCLKRRDVQLEAKFKSRIPVSTPVTSQIVGMLMILGKVKITPMQFAKLFNKSRENDGLTYDLPQHVVVERNRKSCNQALVDFIVATRGTDNHIQSIINGQKKSKWLEMFSNPSAKTMLVPVYLEDQDQIDDVYIHLTSVLDRRPTHTHSDAVKFVMDVLFPESIICVLAALENLTMLEAENTFLRGPVIDISEREEFDRRIGHFLKKSGNPWES